MKHTMKDFLLEHGIKNPSPAEFQKAQQRFAEYSAVMPKTDLKRIQHVVVCLCKLDREIELEKAYLDKGNVKMSEPGAIQSDCGQAKGMTGLEFIESLAQLGCSKSEVEETMNWKSGTFHEYEGSRKAYQRGRRNRVYNPDVILLRRARGGDADALIEAGKRWLNQR